MREDLKEGDKILIRFKKHPGDLDGKQIQGTFVRWHSTPEHIMEILLRYILREDYRMPFVAYCPVCDTNGENETELEMFVIDYKEIVKLDKLQEEKPCEP